VRPIALRMVMELAQMIRSDQDACSDDNRPRGQDRLSRRSLSAIGGVGSGEDAAQFILLGADTVQACTGVMINGYELIHELKAGLLRFMEQHGFNSIEEFRGHSLRYMTTHADLVQRQAAAKSLQRARIERSTTEIAEDMEKELV
jgi:hypothetical protein